MWKKPWEENQVDWENYNWEDEMNEDTQNDDEDEQIVVKDANGNVLQEGDSVIAIKDIKWKGVNIKRWDKFNNISFTDDEWLIYVPKQKLYLKTEFFKKA